MTYLTHCSRDAAIASWVVLAILIFTTASRGEMIDQYYVVPPSTTSILASIIDNRFDHAQTFAAQLSGQLARIEIGVYRYSSETADLWFELRRTGLDGIPELSNDSLLYSERLNSNRVPTSDEINFLSPFNSLSIDLLTSNIQIHAGDKLAMVLRSPTAVAGYSWWVAAGQDIDPYSNGDSYFRVNSSPWDRASTFFDNHFAEYLVPESSVFGLLFLPLVFALATWRSKYSSSWSGVPLP